MKKKSRRIFADMTVRISGMGAFTKKTLRISLAGGMIWLSAYQAMDGAMSHRQFGKG